MKNFQHIFLLLLTTILLMPIAKAQNIVQLTGGNYIFAEDGKLTFNLEPSIFKNRNWKYDSATDSVVTTFNSKQFDFKTKYSSDFYAYETAFNRAYPNHMYASNGYLVRPIYQPNRSGFGNRQAALPALLGVVRIGGQVARAVLPPMIEMCAKNAKCVSAVAGTAIGAAELCFIQYELQLFNLPKGVCEKVEQAGYSKNADGEYESKIYFEISGNSGEGFDYEENIIGRKFTSKESLISFLEEKCNSVSSVRDGMTGENIKILNKSFKFDESKFISRCSVELEKPLFAGAKGGTFLNYINIRKKTETLQMVDLQSFASEDFKENPNDYMNDTGALGTNLRAVITPNQADITMGNSGSGGTFSVISSPYRDNNGETKQDIVNIGAPKSEPNPQLGGNSSNPTSGVSNTYNNVTVNNLSRPDLEGDSKAGENNSANGTKGSSVNGSSGSSNGTDDEESGGNHCEENANTLSCAQLGDVQDSGDNPFSGSIGKSEINTQFEADNFLPMDGSCPAHKQVMLMGKQYEFSYNIFCNYSEGIRAVVIVLATLAAAFIIFGKKVV